MGEWKQAWRNYQNSSKPKPGIYSSTNCCGGGGGCVRCSPFPPHDCVVNVAAKASRGSSVSFSGNASTPLPRATSMKRDERKMVLILLKMLPWTDDIVVAEERMRTYETPALLIGD